MRSSAGTDRLILPALAVGFVLAPYVPGGWGLDLTFAAAIGCVLLGALPRLGEVAPLARRFGLPLGAMAAAWALCVLRGASSGTPLETVMLHGAGVSPLLLAPLFGVALGHGAQAWKRLRLLVLWLACAYAVWILVESREADLSRRVLMHGKSVEFLLVGTALALRLAEEPETRRTRAIVCLAAALLFGLAVIALRSRALTILWLGTAVFGIARRVRRGPEGKAGWVAGAVLVAGVAAFAAMSGFGAQLLGRFGLMADPLGDLPRVREALAVWDLATSDAGHFFLGHGFGAEYSFTRRGQAVHEWTGSYTHNLITYFLLTGGLLSMAAAGWYLLRLLRLGWPGARALPARGGTRGLGDGLVIGVLLLVVHNMGTGAQLLTAVLAGGLCSAVGARASRADGGSGDGAERE